MWRRLCLAALQAPSPYHQTLTSWRKKANRTRGVGTGVTGIRGQGELWVHLLQWQHPNPHPRKNKYRLIRQTPSYCDESLLGSWPESTGWEAKWRVRGNAAKLHALFWTTPVIPRGSHSPHPKETPVRAVHPAGPSKTECRVVASSWRLSVNGLDTLRPLRQEHSRSLTHLHVPGTGHHPPVSPAQMGLEIPGLPLQGSPSRDPWWLPGLLQSVFQCQLCPPPPQGRATQKAKRPWKWVSWSFLYICPWGHNQGQNFRGWGW